mmetsp:Transcript_26600/g.83209  ORF Transcript_26600/g.83209 Transcript_26600/m.83209 type:complete len:452 (-) Transcript_26600:2912-4267(-)
MMNGGAWLRHQMAIPAGMIAVMGLLDSLGGFLSTIGGAYTPGPMQTLLNQTVIPLTLFMSACFLGIRFNTPQCVGAFVILCGASVALVPSFVGEGDDEGESKPDKSVEHGQHHGGDAATMVMKASWVGPLIFFLSVVPAAFSNVYKEAAFNKVAHADVYILTSVVSTLQVIIGFALLPLLALPGFGGEPVSELPLQMERGTRCFLGENSLHGDDCGSCSISWPVCVPRATLAMVNYIVVNFVYNVLNLLVTKHASAALLVMSASLALPVSNLAFSIPALAGDAVEPVSSWNILGLLVVLTGFLIYRVIGSAGASDEESEAEDEEEPYMPRKSSLDRLCAPLRLDTDTPFKANAFASLPLQAGGSMMYYTQPEPGPRMRRRQSWDGGMKSPRLYGVASVSYVPHRHQPHLNESPYAMSPGSGLRQVTPKMDIPGHTGDEGSPGGENDLARSA